MKTLGLNLILLFLLLLYITTYAQPKTAYYCFPCGKDCDRQAYSTKGKCPHCGMDLVMQSVSEQPRLTLITNTKPIDTNKLDSLFGTLSKNNLAMGSITIAQNGKVVYNKAVGFANTQGGNNVPASTQTDYRIGSISKMFTAIIIFQLLEEKKLTLDEKLSKYFPSLPNAKLITISNMLNHRSGLPNFTGDNYADLVYKPQSHEQLLTRLANRKPDFQPNTKADYNNNNYLLLSYIIEKICNKPYKDVLFKRVLFKLHLANTYYASRKVGDEASSFKYIEGKWVKDKEAYLDNFSGAGAILSTPSDLVKFADALFNYRVLSKSSVNSMQAVVDGYGMGMFPFHFGDKTGFGHNGKLDGFEASLSYYASEKLAIAYCTNGGFYQKADILDGVLHICFGTPYTIPSFIPVKLSNKELESYSGTYLSSQGDIKVLCTNDSIRLLLETKGHKFPVENIGHNHFMNSQLGLFFTFNELHTGLTIKEVDQTYYLVKKD